MAFYPETAGDNPPPPPPKRGGHTKLSYVGAPAVFKLELACQQVNAAFPNALGCYLVGSAISRPDWRDVDVRLILTDEDFVAEFPQTLKVSDWAVASWEHDPKWILLSAGVAGHLCTASGLPVDFQFQPQTYANSRHSRPRSALGLNLTGAVE